ncbi:MAG TPA: hypothetical protein DGJ56_08980, partial [Verrucomicrobiales bacterium]|nr:hypothetical protein [Verrucomicrobiales bacterium]
DGFIAYLNGNRVASANAPSTTRWNSGATALHDDQLAVVAQSFDISLYRENLAKGKNVLAIHGLNYEKNSSDMLIVAELVYAYGEGDGTALPVCEPPVERTPESILLSGRLVGHQPDSKA